MATARVAAAVPVQRARAAAAAAPEQTEGRQRLEAGMAKVGRRHWDSATSATAAADAHWEAAARLPAWVNRTASSRGRVDPRA